MTYPTQYPEWLKVAAEDGRGGNSAQVPSVVRGFGCTFRLNLGAHPTLGDWTSGFFSAVVRASPDGGGTGLAEFAATTGTPSGGITPITFDLDADEQGSLPDDTDGDGVTEAFLQIDYAPDSGAPLAILQTRILIVGAV